MLLDITHLSKAYHSGDVVTPVLSDISLQLDAGESLAIIGPSGSGKSTLLNIIGTLDEPTSGRVMLNNRDLSTLSESERAALRATQLGFIFQLHHLLPQLSVLENVLVPTLALPGKNSRQPDAMSRAHRLLDRVGLAHRWNHRPGQISGGERQRVAVVRALINEPNLVLADEPTGSLDHGAAENLAHLLVELNREEGVSVIVVTHAQDLAAKMGSVLELRDGGLIR